MNTHPSPAHAELAQAATASLGPLTEASASDSLDETSRCQLSRFVSLKPQPSGGLLVESLLTGQRLEIDSPSRWRIVSALLYPTRVADLLRGLEGDQREAILGFLRHCHESQFLTLVDDDGQPLNESDALSDWEHHDLLFHMRSRRGRSQQTVGATFHRVDALPPSPPFKAPPAPDAIQLYRPDIETLRTRDRSFTEVLEERRSRYSVEPVSLRDLGELLYRACRVTGTLKAAGGETLIRKVYPSGGSFHSLETYALIERCPEVAPGLYHYHPQEHTLSLVTEPSDELRGLLWEAREGTARTLPDLPSVLLIFTTRIRRVTRKYQALAYRVILQEVGVLQQTLYLVATAMGLSPCAVGTGNSDGFARATGIDYYTETSIGEMILGGPLS
ncbi:MAG: SagB family peptide dehydrogenase [Acidobacteriota bacterium]